MPRDVVKVALAALVKVAAAVGMLVLNYVVASRLSVADAGLFMLFIALTMFFANIARYGLDNLIIKLVARDLEQKNSKNIVKLLKLSVFVCSISSIVIAVFLDLFLRISPEGGAYSKLIDVRWLLFCAIYFTSLAIVVAHFMLARGSLVKALSFISATTPAVFVIVTLFFSDINFLEMIVVYVVSVLITTTACFLVELNFLCRFVKTDSSPSCEVIAGLDLVRQSWSFFQIVLSIQVVLWSSQLLLGFISDPDSVAHFAVSQRISILVSFFLVAMNGVVTPKFSAMYAAGDIAGIKATLYHSVRLLSIVGLCFLVMVFVFHEYLLAIFGEEYKGFGILLVILASGQFINVSTGPVSNLLMMTGKELVVKRCAGLGAVAAVLSGLVLIPFFDVVGAAISTAFAISLQNILAAIYVNRKLKINILNSWRRGGLSSLR